MDIIPCCYRQLYYSCDGHNVVTSLAQSRPVSLCLVEFTSWLRSTYTFPSGKAILRPNGNNKCQK